MQKSIITLLMLGWLAQFSLQSPVYGQPTSRRTIQVRINPNVELLGFVYFLGYEGAQLETNDSYLKSRSIKRSEWYSYGFSLYKQYKRYKASPHLAIIVGYAERIWLDYLINLLLQLDDFPNAWLTDQIHERYYLRFSPGNNAEEARRNASQFIDAMNQLYREVDFGSYLHSSAKRYDQALTQVRRGLPGRRFIPAMEAFYGRRFDAYTFVPSLTIPTGMGFGLNYTLDQKTRTFHVFGPFRPQRFDEGATLDMGFDEPKHLLELSTHEFGHAFVNPVIDSLPAGLIERTAGLFEPIRPFMADQGYTSWKACLYEHFVRAGEILIAQNLGRSRQADELKRHYIADRHFIYLPTLLFELETYNKQRACTYQQAVEKAMQRLREWGSQVPYRQVSQSIDDTQGLHMHVKGVRLNDEKVQYTRRFPAGALTTHQLDSLKAHFLDSLGLKSIVTVKPADSTTGTDVSFTCSNCGRKGYLEVYGPNFVATRKVNARRATPYQFPIHVRLSAGHYQLIYRSWPSKPIRSDFQVEANKPTVVYIR